jgi:hypothetical protein
VILEDQSGRVALGGVMKTITANMVSGVILAVKGSIDEFGEFVVSHHRCVSDIFHNVISHGNR